jgi:hypothetical protein
LRVPGIQEDLLINPIDQRGLVGEVPVEQRLGDPQAPGQFPRLAFEAAFREEAHSPLHDHLLSLFLRDAPPGGALLIRLHGSPALPRSAVWCANAVRALAGSFHVEFLPTRSGRTNFHRERRKCRSGDYATGALGRRMITGC